MAVETDTLVKAIIAILVLFVMASIISTMEEKISDKVFIIFGAILAFILSFIFVFSP